MATVIVVPETDDFRLDVSHAEVVWINSALGVPQLVDRETRYLAPCWVGARSGVWRLYHILSATVGPSNTEIRLGNSFVLPEPWDGMGQHRRFEYHDLAALGLEEVSPGMLRPLNRATGVTSDDPQKAQPEVLSMGKLLIPAQAADDWRCLLADPERHWRPGFSAHALAHCWQSVGDFPLSVRQALESSDTFAGLELLFAIPEVKTPLPGGSRPSQTDLWALARCDAGLISVAVEGKAAESFGPTLGKWQSDGTGKQVRLASLIATLEMSAPPDAGIRYQLLHRTAAAVLEARRFFAPHAVMLVQAFGPARESFADYAAFAALFGATVSPGQVVAVGLRGGVSLHLGWCAGEERFLSA